MWWMGSCYVWTKSSVWTHIWVQVFFFLVVVSFFAHRACAPFKLNQYTYFHPRLCSQTVDELSEEVSLQVVRVFQCLTEKSLRGIFSQWLTGGDCVSASVLLVVSSKGYRRHLPTRLHDGSGSPTVRTSAATESPTESSHGGISPVIFVHCIIFVFHSEAHVIIFMAIVWPLF